MPDSNPDPFQPVLDALNKLSADLTPWSGKIHTASGDVDQVSTAVTKAQDLRQDLDNVFNDMNDVKNICLGLSEIPGADLVADVIGTVTTATQPVKDTLDGIINDLLTPATKVLDDVKAGLARLDNALQIIARDIPAVTSTIVILQSLSSIASGLADALAGTVVADHLKGLLGKYDEIRLDIIADIEALHPFVDGLTTAFHDIEGVFSPLIAVGSGLESAASAVGSVSGILDPISSVMHHIEDAIAPVKWALDAVSCIFNKVVQPVIDGIMSAFHLNSLTDGLAHKLESALGIDHVINDLKNSLSMDAFTAFEHKLGDQAAHFSDGWGKIGDLLSTYSVGKDGAKDAAMQELVNAISGASAGTGPQPIAAWPAPPPFVTPVKSTVKASIHDASFVRINAALSAMAHAQPSAMVLVRHVEPIRFRTLATARPLSSPVAPPLPPLGPQWAVVSAMSVSAENVAKKLLAIPETLSSVALRAKYFRQTAGLGDVLPRQLADVAICLKTANDLAILLGRMPAFGDLAKTVAPAIGSQVDACTLAQKAVAQLSASIESAASSVTNAAAQAPAPAAMTNVAGKLRGWASGAELLARSIDQGRSVKQTPASAAQLTSKADELTKKAAAASANIQAVSHTVDTLQARVDDIDRQLQGYATALLAISAHGATLSASGQSDADQIAHLLGMIDALLNPLSLVMVQLDCIDPAAKADANGALQVFVTASTLGAKQSLDLVQTILSAAIGATLPISQIADEAAKANDVLTSQVLAKLNTATSGLAEAMKTLGTQLQNALQYTFPGLPSPAGNQYLDGPTAADAIALNKALSATFATGAPTGTLKDVSTPTPTPTISLFSNDQREHASMNTKASSHHDHHHHGHAKIEPVWIDAIFQNNPILLPTHKHLLGAPMANDEPSDPLEIWKKWCAGFTIMNGIAAALKTLLTSGKLPISNAAIKQDILAALYVLNVSLVKVDAAFLSYIKSGGKDVFSIDPPPVDAWPDPAEAPEKASVEYFESGFDILSGALSLMSNTIAEKLKDHPEMQPIFAVITTLVGNEKDLIKAMKMVMDPTATVPKT